MKKINEIKDFRQIVEKATEPARQYNKKSDYQLKPDRARFKLVTWFKDGNKKTFYSYDFIKQPKGGFVLDEWNGLFKLIRLCKGYIANDKLKSAMIYTNLDQDPKTAKAHYFYPAYKFTGKDGEKHNKRILFNKKGSLVMDQIKIHISKEQKYRAYLPQSNDFLK